MAELSSVLEQYRMILDLGSTYGPYLDQGRRPPHELDPRALKVDVLAVAIVLTGAFVAVVVAH